MTENERMSISGLLDVLDTGISLSTCHIEYAIQSNVLEDLIRCLEELEQYRAIGTVEDITDGIKQSEEEFNMLTEYLKIGTVEEFKALKEKKNVLPIATIKISKEDMQKMVDEKVAQIELDIQEIRAKAIDGYMYKLCEYCIEQPNECYKLECPFCGDGCDIVNIAEQLKGGEKNG